MIDIIFIEEEIFVCYVLVWLLVSILDFSSLVVWVVVFYSRDNLLSFM